MCSPASYKYSNLQTLIVASSLAEMITLNTGWNATRVTGPRWPIRLYFSGGRGIQSDGLRRSLGWPPPVWISFSVSDNRASRSITYQHDTELLFLLKMIRWRPTTAFLQIYQSTARLEKRQVRKQLITWPWASLVKKCSWIDPNFRGWYLTKCCSHKNSPIFGIIKNFNLSSFSHVFRVFVCKKTVFSFGVFLF